MGKLQFQTTKTQTGRMVAIGEMPLWFYLPLHSEATLSKEEIELIVTWSGLRE